MNILAALCFEENSTLSPACCPLIFMDVAMAWVSKSLSLPSSKPEFVLTYLPASNPLELRRVWATLKLLAVYLISWGLW